MAAARTTTPLSNLISPPLAMRLVATLFQLTVDENPPGATHIEA